MENAQPGHTVEFHGLKGAAHLNGTSGHLVRFLPDLQRWAVRCDDSYEIVNAKPENLRRLNVRSENIYVENPLTGQIMVPADSQPVMDPSTQIEGMQELHESVLGAYYTLKKGGVVVSCGDKYMLAFEFFGSHGNGGVVGEMTFVDTDRNAQAVVKGRKCKQAKELGRNFLMGETVVYYDTEDESVFFALLRKYKTHAKDSGLIDMKSGLRLYKDVKINK